MTAMRVLLLGADGQLGTELRRSLAPLGEVVAATRDGSLGDGRCEQADFSEPGTLPALVRFTSSRSFNSATSASE